MTTGKKYNMETFVTGKNEAKLSKWLVDTKRYINTATFFHLEFEEKIGVYLAYYDSLGVEIMVKSWRQSKNVFIYSVNELYKESCYSNDEDKIFNTRNEAYKEAFKKADEMLNQKYNVKD